LSKELYICSLMPLEGMQNTLSAHTQLYIWQNRTATSAPKPCPLPPPVDSSSSNRDSSN